MHSHNIDGARLRREDDQRLAALLIEGGIQAAEVYTLPGDPDALDQIVSDDGEWVEVLGRPIRRWAGFPTQAHQNKLRRGLFYAAYAAVKGIAKVLQIRVAAPVCSVRIEEFGSTHAKTSRQVKARLRYGIQKFAPNLKVDIIASHVIKDGPGRVYIHFHIVARDGTATELEALRKYWCGPDDRQTGWDWCKHAVNHAALTALAVAPVLGRDIRE